MVSTLERLAVTIASRVRRFRATGSNSEEGLLVRPPRRALSNGSEPPAVLAYRRDHGRHTRRSCGLRMDRQSAHRYDAGAARYLIPHRGHWRVTTTALTTGRTESRATCAIRREGCPARLASATASSLDQARTRTWAGCRSCHHPLRGRPSLGPVWAWRTGWRSSRVPGPIFGPSNASCFE